MRKKIFFSQILVFFLLYNMGHAQVHDLCVPVNNKNAIQLYEEAYRIIPYDYRQGYSILQEALEMEPYFYQAYYLIAVVNYDKALDALTDIHEIQNLERYYSRAENNFLRVLEYCPSFEKYQSHFYLGEFYYDSKQYKKSELHLNAFISQTNLKGEKLKKAKLMHDGVKAYLDLTENPVLFNPVILQGVCTKDDEFLPYISPDGNYAFYTKRYKKKTFSSYASKYIEEFTKSEKLERSDSLGEIYGNTETMPLPFNDGRNQGAVSMTIDNNQIFITICDFTQVNNRAYKNCDIYVCYRINGNWTELINLGESINKSNSWEGQPSISADGNTLYFASAREGGFGGIDIYRSFRTEDGSWTPAANLGNVINTKGDDKSPFIHADNQTLYFSSNGRPGMGGFDIFMSKLQNKKYWATPINIGYPINTKDDDLGFIVSTNGQKAYFSSNKLDGIGGWDIYSFHLHEAARPKKVLFVKGHLEDEKGEILADAEVQLKSVQTSKITEGIVDKMTGKYAVAVSVLKNEEFIMTVKKKDYAFTSQFIDPYDEEFEEPQEIDFEVKKVEEGTNVKLNNIYFAFNSDQLDRRSKIVLDNFGEYLVENPRLIIRIDGHTDDIDTDEFNMDLSIRRAKVVHDYLIDFGIESRRLSFKGYGETVPVADNLTDKGRALNRRTEFVILDK